LEQLDFVVLARQSWRRVCTVNFSQHILVQENRHLWSVFGMSEYRAKQVISDKTDITKNSVISRCVSLKHTAQTTALATRAGRPAAAQGW